MDKEYQKLKEKTVENEKNQIRIDFSLNGRWLLLHKNRLYRPNTKGNQINYYEWVTQTTLFRTSWIPEDDHHDQKGLLLA